MRAGVACLSASYSEAKVCHAPLADALDSARHAAVFGCGHRSCERAHVVVIRQAERYRVRSFEAAESCACRVCEVRLEKARVRAREWYRENHARGREVQAKYRAANADKVREKSRLWQQANKQHRAEYNRRYVEANRERIREYQRERYRQCKAAKQSAAGAATLAAAETEPAAGCGTTGQPVQADTGRIL